MFAKTSCGFYFHRRNGQRCLMRFLNINFSKKILGEKIKGVFYRHVVFKKKRNAYNLILWKRSACHFVLKIIRGGVMLTSRLARIYVHYSTIFTSIWECKSAESQQIYYFESSVNLGFSAWTSITQQPMVQQC